MDNLAACRESLTATRIAGKLIDWAAPMSVSNGLSPSEALSPVLMN
jgi:hypothetical protein